MYRLSLIDFLIFSFSSFGGIEHGFGEKETIKTLGLFKKEMPNTTTITIMGPGIEWGKEESCGMLKGEF